MGIQFIYPYILQHFEVHSEDVPQILKLLASFPNAMSGEEIIRKSIFKPLILLYLAALEVLSFFSFTSFHSSLHSKISKDNYHVTLFRKRNEALLPVIFFSEAGHCTGVWTAECLILAGVV